jgi:CheY-like chemotaxis protein
LSISREFASLLGGRVKVHSRLEEGSCFRLLVRLEAGAGPGKRPAELHGLRVGLRVGGGLLERILREQVGECGGSVVETGAEVVLVDAEEWAGPAAGARVVAVAVRPKAGEAARLAGMGAEAYLVHPVTAAELGRILLERRGRESGPQAVEALAGEPRVLLVEDERVNQQVSRRMLERLGCVVEVASSGAEAIRLADRGRYDAILMDWHMPGMDGLETTAVLRERERARGTRPTAIIAQTASAMAGDRERCIGEGMDDFLAKPLSLEALRAVLERWVTVSLATEKIGH